MIEIRPASEAEAPTLSALAERSKAYWQYPADWLDMWRQDGAFDITPEMCRSGGTQVAESESGNILGFYHLVQEGRHATLEHLWVEPDYIRSSRRIGKRLLQHALHEARAGGQMSVELSAEPEAVGFYEKYGLEVVWMPEPEDTPDRELPRMRILLTD